MNEKYGYGRTEVIHTINMSIKDVRRIGFNLGYGIYTGIAAGIFVINICKGVAKAAKNWSKKKAISVEVTPDEEEETKT